MPCCIIELHERVRLGKIDNKLKVTNAASSGSYFYRLHGMERDISERAVGREGERGRGEFLVSQFMRFDVRLPGTKE